MISCGRQLGELANSDDELEEVAKLQLDVRDMESDEWSQPVLAIAAGDGESSREP